LTFDQKEVKKSAEEFYEIFGEALKHEPNTEEFEENMKAALEKMQESLFDLTIEDKEKKEGPLEKLWSNIFGTDVYQDGKLEAGITMNVMYNTDSESENAIKGFLKGLEEEKTVTIKANDQASETIKDIAAMEIPDKFFEIVGKRREEVGSGSGGGEGGAFAIGGYTANVGRNTPAGIVHGGEWVAPAWMVQDSKFSRAIESLEESRRTRGYANGGMVAKGDNETKFVQLAVYIDNFVGTNDEAGNIIAEIAYTKLKDQGYLA